MSRFLIALTVLIGAACGTSERPLTNTEGSPAALTRQVLESVAANDGPRLRSLTLDEQEFRRHVWPQLPASRPERNLPFSYVWGDLHQKSEQSLQSMLARHGGRRYELLDVSFEGSTDYVTFRVHRNTRLVVRDQSGTRVAVQLFGSMIEKDGAFKIFSYVVDE